MRTGCSDLSGASFHTTCESYLGVWPSGAIGLDPPPFFDPVVGGRGAVAGGGTLSACEPDTFFLLPAFSGIPLFWYSARISSGGKWFITQGAIGNLENVGGRRHGNAHVGGHSGEELQ